MFPPARDNYTVLLLLNAGLIGASNCLFRNTGLVSIGYAYLDL
jgi:hypothetical protein